MPTPTVKEVLDALALVSRQGACPTHLWIPQIGWVDLTKPIPSGQYKQLCNLLSHPKE